MSPPASGTEFVTRRETLPSSREGRLLYAQVHEDPRLEITALAPVFGGRIAVVTSGGCTALSLRAAGAREVIGIDSNRSQNHVTELKAAVCAQGDAPLATAFLGGYHSTPRQRRAQYQQWRDALTHAARAYWDARPELIERGAITAGVSERFMSGIARAMRVLVHPASRIERLLACRTLEEQRAFYHTEWNSRRWRLLFRLLLTRGALERTYEAGMYTSVRTASIGELFHAQFGRTITELPVADNYFLHQALTGGYRAESPAALPPYLTMRRTPGELSLVDAPLTEWLRTQPARSLHGFAISNICEWLDEDGIDALFAEMARTATDGAIVCFRNFVGWTEVPARWRDAIVEDRARGDALFAQDRSLVNRRFAICRVAAQAS